ncbi:hypothetical protein DSO57_1034600 [Entomophthora muscae]|uniref:Uncharacterized protein n=1 Tax=Entomophthora muscae TaxID=34485 RepID=A0ACC2S209_9FUNG|nr:hypothetical protein DSO57_1034600 [Entomophthora muscae]
MSLAPNWENHLFSLLILRNSLAPLMPVASDPTVLGHKDSLLCACAAPQNTTEALAELMHAKGASEWAVTAYKDAQLIAFNWYPSVDFTL